MQQFTMIGQLPLRYAATGEGETVFLVLHGFLESIEIFEKFTDRLSAHARVIIPDLPGCGLSGYDGRECLSMDYMAETAYALLTKLGIGRCTVIGHSMGGYVALSLAERHPEAVEGLVLLHSSPYAPTEKRIEERRHDLQMVLSGHMQALVPVNSKERFAKENWNKHRNDIEDLAEAVELCDVKSFAAQIRGLIERESKEEVFRAFPGRKLMVFGCNDSYIQYGRAQETASAFPESGVLWLEHSGHMGFVEEPERIIDALADGGFICSQTAEETGDGKPETL